MEYSTAEPANAESLTLRETFRRVREDFSRIATFHGESPAAHKLFWLVSPSVISLTLYRISRYCYTRGIKPLAWMIYMANLYITGADIPPTTIIGRRCMIGHVTGTVICGTVGDDATFHCAPGIGGGIERAKPGREAYGLPVIGNDVVIGARATILGAIFIGDHCLVGPAAVVTRDMEPRTIAMARPSIFTSSRDLKEDAPGTSVPIPDPPRTGPES